MNYATSEKLTNKCETINTYKIYSYTYNENFQERIGKYSGFIFGILLCIKIYSQRSAIREFLISLEEDANSYTTRQRKI